MKNIHLIMAVFIGLTMHLYGQEPMSLSGSNVSAGTPSEQYWSRAGNDAATRNNVFGTRYNSPVYFITGGVPQDPYNLRMKLAGNILPNLQFPINSYNRVDGVNTTGNLLIGGFGFANPSFQDLYNQMGGFSRLHLNGTNQTVQEFGSRPWMKTGVTFTDHQDFAYFGLRNLEVSDAIQDFTELAVLWADNASGAYGSDRFSLRFSGFDSPSTGVGKIISTDRTSAIDLDGLMVGQFLGTGLIGFGNVFGVNSTSVPGGLYNDPSSLLHLSYDLRTSSTMEKYGYLQITYRDDNNLALSGTGVSQNDGLRLGIENNPDNGGLSGMLRWQEQTPFIFQTDYDNVPGQTNLGERIRISSTSAFGVPATMDNFVNTTRVSIPYRGNVALSQPRALLHIGQNVSATAYASWMDYGNLVSTAAQSIFTGITPITHFEPRMAIVGFAGSDLSVTNVNTGEMLRLNQQTGNFGIGNFGPVVSNGLGVAPAEKLDVNGNGRFRQMPTATGDHLILGQSSLIPSNANDVTLRKKKFSGNALEYLGGDGEWHVLPAGGGGNPGEFFDCNATEAFLPFSSRFHLNQHNFYFEGSDEKNDFNKVGIGHGCGDILVAKLDVLEVGSSRVGAKIRAIDTRPNITGSISGIIASSDAEIDLAYGIQAAGQSTKVGAASFGVRGIGTGFNGVNFGGHFAANSPGSSYDAVGVYAESQTSNPNNWAGFFNGDVFSSSGNYLGSDSLLKTNVVNIDNGLELIKKLNLKNYYMDTNNFNHLNFDSKLQSGFIAQEVERVAPHLIKEFNHPGRFDSTGNFVQYPTRYKAVNYIGLIPINTSAIKQLSEKVDSLQLINNSSDSVINSLNDRLTALENCLLNLLPSLCQINQGITTENSLNEQQQIREKLEVILSSNEAIILDQNVPNPFAEKTEIRFSIPESVEKANMVFFDSNGKVMNNILITERGLGSVIVYGQDLSKGMYTYSLIADGVAVASKKMVKL